MNITLAYKNNEKFDLDGYICELMELHFDPKEGTPYWLEKQEKTGINYRKEITSVDDLYKLGFANEPDGTEIMSKAPTRYFVPKKILREEMTKLIPGETTGTRTRKYPVWHENYMNEVISSSDFVLDLYNVPRNIDWLSVRPSGLLGRWFEGLARLRGGFCYLMPVDGILGKKVLASGDKNKIEEMFGHIFKEMMRKSKIEKIGVTMNLPVALFNLSEQMDISNLKCILWGGAPFPITHPSEWKGEVESFKALKGLYKEIILGGFYGNGLFGPLWYLSDGSNRLNYYSILEQYIIPEVINPETEEKVRYGERGQLVFTALRKEFLLRWKERDAANRIYPKHNHDGIQNVGPLETINL